MGNDYSRLEFDLGQKWAKGLRMTFHTQAESAALNLSDVVRTKQVHGKKIIEWSPGKSDYSAVEADGIIARGSNFRESVRTLLVRTADCAPLMYVDRENECAAVVHAGWRGLAQGIHLLPFKMGFAPATTWIWCGPCLNGTSFEVGADMWSQFSLADQSIFFLSEIEGIRAGKDKKFFASWKFLEESFHRAGAELFYNVEVDTFTSTEYASYRRSKQSEETTPLQHNYSTLAFIS